MEELKANKLDQNVKAFFSFMVLGSINLFFTTAYANLRLSFFNAFYYQKLYPKHEDQVKAIQAYTAF